MFLMTDESLTSLAKKVPDLLNYTNENPLIDFSNNLSEQLYNLIGLTLNEVKYVEDVILKKDDESEYLRMLSMSYQEITSYLLKKYGVAKHNYFKDTSCTIKNPLVSRASEGLYCHHIDEDKAIMLSNDKYAAVNPFEYQKADRLVYCNLLEHLILHVKITEEPRNIDSNDNELPGIGGAVNFICKELNDIYAGKDITEEWRIKAADRVKNSFDDYIIILKHLWSVIDSNPLLKSLISKENLCIGFDGKIIPSILNALISEDD